MENPEANKGKTLKDLLKEVEPDQSIEEDIPEPGTDAYYKWYQAKQFEENQANRPVKKRKSPAEQYPSLYGSRMIGITKMGETRRRSKR